MSMKPNTIVLHCSDSHWGTAMVINHWHIERGWRMIGYHDIILNGYPTFEHHKVGIRDEMLDGTLEVGRKLDPDGLLESDEYGAHVKGHNSKSIGICVISKHGELTPKQKAKLIERVRYRMKQFSLGVHNIKGHYELDSKKTCPNFDMKNFRNDLLKDMGVTEYSVDKVRKSFFARMQMKLNSLIKNPN